jgi:hypothetical protein
VFSNLFREGVDYPSDYVMVLMKRANKNRMTFGKGILWINVSTKWSTAPLFNSVACRIRLGIQIVILVR